MIISPSGMKDYIVDVGRIMKWIDKTDFINEGEVLFSLPKGWIVIPKSVIVEVST